MQSRELPHGNDSKPPKVIHLQYDSNGDSTWCSDYVDETDWQYQLAPMQDCLACSGNGDSFGEHCEQCNGSGKVAVAKRLEQEALL